MSGVYDAYYPTTSHGYNYGSSWRQAEPQVAYERSHQFPNRRRTPSPSRQHRAYDGYYTAENNLGQGYHMDESAAYFNRTPTPDRYPTRAAESDNWDRLTQWSSPSKSSSWQDPTLSPSTLPLGRARNDSVLATRMFEPSAAWKQTHPDRANRPNLSRGHNVNLPYSPVAQRLDRSPPAARGDRYRPPHAHGNTRFDSYRHGMSPQASRRPLPRHDFPVRRISTSGSIMSVGSSVSSRAPPRSPYSGPRETRPRHRSVSRGRRSHTASSSRGRRSPSRNRLSLDRNSSRSRDRPARSRRRSSPSSRRRSQSRDLRSSGSCDRYSRSRSLSHRSESRSKTRSRRSSTDSRGRRSYRSHWDLPGASRRENGKESWSPSSSIRSSRRSSIASTRRSASRPADSAEGMMGKEESECLDVKPSTMSKSEVVDVVLAPPPTSFVTSNEDLYLQRSTSADATVTRPSSPKGLISDQADDTIKLPPSNDLQSSGLSIAAELTPPTEGQHSLLVFHSVTATAPQPTKNLNAFSTSDAPLTPRVLEKAPASVLLTTQPALAPLILPRPPPRLEDIPDCSDAKSKADVLRIVVMTRLLCDRQTQEERVEPVLRTNRSIASLQRGSLAASTPGDVIKEVIDRSLSRAKFEPSQHLKSSLVDRFRERQLFLAEKTKRLKREYLALQERWSVHCARLDEQSKPPAAENEPIHTSGRTTRRSIATLGDAVRSDLEMEQVIASLGNDDATDPSHLSLRNLAIIPDLVSVTRGQVDYVYDDTNHLVLNPAEYYGPTTGIHDWTEHEKAIFLDKFAAHPKQFGIIAEHISNKTAAQCVDYYYLHKKTLIDFRQVVARYAPGKKRRRGTGKKRGNGLLADIRQHDAEVHKDVALDSLSIGGSMASANGRTSRAKNKTPLNLPEPKDVKQKGAPSSKRRLGLQIEGTTPLGSETPTPEPDVRRKRRITVIPTSHPTSQTIPSGVEDIEEVPEEVERPAKRPKRARRIKSVAIITEEGTTPEPGSAAEQNESASSSRRKSQSLGVLWSEEDKRIFLSLLAQYGDDFKRIAASMPNKTTVQVNHYYKANMVELNLEQVAARAPKRSPTPEKETHVVPTRSITIESSAPMSYLSPPAGPPPSYVHHDLQARTLLSAAPTVGPHSVAQSPIYSYTSPLYPPQPGLPSLPYGHPSSVSSSYPPQAVPYAYPPYSDPNYPLYDTRVSSLSSISLTDPLHGRPITPRSGNPYSVSYPYSLESS